jgi:hypothetical protein
MLAVAVWMLAVAADDVKLVEINLGHVIRSTLFPGFKVMLRGFRHTAWHMQRQNRTRPSRNPRKSWNSPLVDQHESLGDKQS